MEIGMLVESLDDSVTNQLEMDERETEEYEGWLENACDRNDWMNGLEENHKEYS